MNYYLDVLKKYVEFTGRARRKEYWMFVLISFLISIAISLIGHVVGIPLLSYVYALAVLLPSLSVAVRRLHDTSHSGWWFLIVLIPLVGAVVLIVFLATDSMPGPNQYGPNPKGV